MTMDDITNQLIIIKPDDLEEVKSELREIKNFSARSIFHKPYFM